ncbi:hypothetical protein BH09VER1_BH09VER1_14780 [soil metagenome]
MSRQDLIFVFVKCLGLYIVATALPSFITSSVSAWLYFTHPANPSATIAPLIYAIQGPAVGALGLIVGFQLLFNTSSMASWIQRNDPKK